MSVFYVQKYLIQMFCSNDLDNFLIHSSRLLCETWSNTKDGQWTWCYNYFQLKGIFIVQLNVKGRLYKV